MIPPEVKDRRLFIARFICPKGLKLLRPYVTVAHQTGSNDLSQRDFLMTDLAYRTTTQLAAMIADGELGSEELLDHLLARVDRLNPKLNAIVVDCRERAREACRAADKARAQGGLLGPLHGVPMTVKEAYDLAGTPTTWGIPELKGNIAQHDAVLVERLQFAGAIVYGKTNVPLNLSDLQSYNEIYGQTGNPWDPSRVPGGSSGGSAASLAAGFAPLEMGSDIGGSIRNPAHFCGTFGHKPTWGLLPMRGHAPTGSLSEIDIAVCGPMARSAHDLALAVDLLAYPDDLAPAVNYDLRPLLADRFSDLKIAVWATDPVAPVSAEMVGRAHEVGQRLADMGAEVNFEARPDIDPEAAYDCYQQLLFSALSGATPSDAFARIVEKATDLAPDDMSAQARAIRGTTLSHRDWLRCNERRVKMRWAWNRFFTDYDALIMPVFPTSAFAHDHSPKISERMIQVDAQHVPYMRYVFWAGLTGVSYLPSTVIPTGPGADGLPLGLQIVGPEYGDRTTIGIASMLERIGYQFKAPPDLD